MTKLSPEVASKSRPRTVLTLNDLSVNLSGRSILRDITLAIDESSLIGLIGPNGAGKTTLLRSIMGLIPTACGTTEYDELPGYVPQRHDIAWDYPISVEQTVMTALSMGMRPWQRVSARHWEAVYKALSMVGMLDLRQRTLNELSGGQKQRVLIARALARSPKLLLLDEPFTGLDHPTQDDLTELFRKLAANGVAILMSTHDLSQAVDVCDRLVLLNGTIIAEGTPEELSHAHVWRDTFCVGAHSTLLRIVGAVDHVASNAVAPDRPGGDTDTGSSSRNIEVAADDASKVSDAAVNGTVASVWDPMVSGDEGVNVDATAQPFGNVEVKSGDVVA